MSKLVRTLPVPAWLQRRWVLALLVLLAAVSAGRGVWNATARPNASQDFQWDSARVLLQRQNPYAAALSGAPTAVDGIQPGRIEPNQVPSCLILLWPFAALPWPLAKWAWAMANLGFTGLLLAVTFRLFLPGAPAWKYVAVTCLFLIGTPWRNLIGNGQHLLFSLAFFVWAVALAERGRPLRSGLVLALSFFKYTTIFALLPLFLKKRWGMPILIAFGVHGVLHLFACIWLRTDPITLMLQPLRIGARLRANGIVDVFALWQRLAPDRTVFVPAAAGLLLLGAGIVLARRAQAGADLLALSFLAVLSMLVVYHHNYDFVVFLFPLVWLARPPAANPVSPTSQLAVTCRTALPWLLGACIGMAFYVRKLVDVAVPRLAGSAGTGLHTAAWLVTVLLCYSSCACLAAAVARPSAATTRHREHERPEGE